MWWNPERMHLAIRIIESMCAFDYHLAHTGKWLVVIRDLPDLDVSTMFVQRHALLCRCGTAMQRCIRSTRCCRYVFHSTWSNSLCKWYILDLDPLKISCGIREKKIKLHLLNRTQHVVSRLPIATLVQMVDSITENASPHCLRGPFRFHWELTVTLSYWVYINDKVHTFFCIHIVFCTPLG